MAHYRKTVERILGRPLRRREVIHHIDGNRKNNSIDNLEIMSLSEYSRLHNTGKKYSHKTISKLRRKSQIARPGAILNPSDVKDIRNMLRGGIKQYLIAFAFGVNTRTVNGY